MTADKTDKSPPASPPGRGPDNLDDFTDRTRAMAQTIEMRARRIEFEVTWRATEARVALARHKLADLEKLLEKSVGSKDPPWEKDWDSRFVDLMNQLGNVEVHLQRLREISQKMAARPSSGSKFWKRRIEQMKEETRT